MADEAVVFLRLEGDTSLIITDMEALFSINLSSQSA
jgi:hypothetical protein